MHRNLIRKTQEEKIFCETKHPSHKNIVNENPQASSYNKKSFDPKNVHKNKDRYSKCEGLTYVEGFQCPAKKVQCKCCYKFGHFTSLCYQKKQAPFKSGRPKVYQLEAGIEYAQERGICSQSEHYSSSDDSFCLQIKVQNTQAI